MILQSPRLHSGFSDNLRFPPSAYAENGKVPTLKFAPSCLAWICHFAHVIGPVRVQSVIPSSALLSNKTLSALKNAAEVARVKLNTVLPEFDLAEILSVLFVPIDPR
jgi:hypothetical protein